MNVRFLIKLREKVGDELIFMPSVAGIVRIDLRENYYKTKEMARSGV